MSLTGDLLGTARNHHPGTLRAALPGWSHVVCESDSVVPSSLDDLSAKWLSDALGCSVSSCQVEPVGEVAGLLGLVLRVRLFYAGRAGPESVIVKIPATGPSREYGSRLGIYEREVRFFTELADDAGVEVPACHAALSDNEGNFAIVLEDLGDLRVGDQLRGLSYDDAAGAVRSLAGLHARWWDDPIRASLEWIPDERDHMAEDSVGADHGLLARDWGDVLGPERLARARPVIEAFPAVIEQLDWSPRTLVHGDARGENFMFGEERTVLIDWQLLFHSASGARDLVRLLATSLPEDRLLEMTDQLIGEYQRELAQLGAAGPDEQELRRAMAVVAGFHVVLGARGTQVTLPDDRARRMQAKMVIGFNDLAHHLGAADLR